VRRGAEVAAAALAALVVGVAAPSAAGRASAQAPTAGRGAQDAQPAAPAQAPPVADAGAQIDQVAGELAGLDTQVTQLQAALAQADDVLAKAQVSVEAIRQEATSREQLQAQLVGQARAYAIQRYMYGSADSRDLLAFLSALSKPADDAVWGLATLEVSSEAALDQAEQVAKARAAVADRLAQAESDVTLLTAARARRAQELDAATAQRADVATRFDGVVRELGQATVNGMSTVAYDAYRKAQATLAAEQPGCGLRWELLAAIGKTESNHGVGRLDVFGNSFVPIIGIPIGGDTDGGALDGDAGRDHAVGPMQFIPSTWRKWGTDANGDGKADPGNIVDAATAAGRYLCRAAGDLTLGTEAGVIRAILSYNPNQTYLRVVGARFEALASDLALGWFSAAALPPAPAPPADVAPNAGPDGREATGNGPTLATPPATIVTEVRVFGARDLTTPTTAPVTVPPGECAGPTLALDPRAGFLRCGPIGGVLLDPCEVAPYDATLVGCLPDPTGTPVLLRVAGPAARVELGTAPPYRLLVLDGGDRCLPIPATEPTQAPPPAPTTTSTTAGGTTSAAPPTSGSAATSTSPTTGPSSSAPSRRGTTTTTTSTSAAAAAAATGTDAATTSAAPRAKASNAAKASTTSSSAPTTPAPSATIPLAERPTYTCASGATVIGPPNSSGATWVALVRQAGLADRQLVVVQALS
jgi:membrane-bound lytic murein transglycosylase B